jgi:NadR type nicotinamide-nucleotide adenylyltransferase
MLKRIAITGPESTGKSSLAKELARYYKCSWVPEYAREYLNKLERDYNYNDLLLIAKGQKRLENKMALAARGFLFCDTELTVTKIWCEFKYGKVHPWINENLKAQQYDLYFLMNIDLPWEADPLREYPGNRKELFDMYISELQYRGVPFDVISGNGGQRVNQAIQILNQRFN